MTSISLSSGLPDIVSVQKRVYPLIFTAIVSEQPTTQPIATSYGFKKMPADADDGSGWTHYGFRLDRWFSNVKSHKLKTDVSIELLTDLRSLGLGEEVVIDNLADQIADDINLDIINALNIVSTNGAAINIDGSTSKFNQGRQLYAEVHAIAAKMETTTGMVGTYVVGGGLGFELLLGSSHAERVPDTNTYILDSGMILVHDKFASTDYVTIGVKKKVGEFELSSIVFSPYDYTQGSSDGLAYQVIATDPLSLSPVYGVFSRSAITAAPIGQNQQGVVEIDWDNPGAIENSSELSSQHTIIVS